MKPAIHRFDSRTQASVQAAKLLGAALQQRLEANQTATLVVSGGSTPQACLQHLAQTPLPWHRVLVTLTDERCVDAQHPDSNERMLRQHLLVDCAAEAQFVPLQEIGSLEKHPKPFAAVLLGMGADGHFASLFPDAPNLSEGLDLHNARSTMDVQTNASSHRRISMTLSRLLNAETMLLLAFGKDKEAVLLEPATYPVASLLQEQPQHPSMQILWAE